MLTYELEKTPGLPLYESLYRPLGVSNHFIGAPARIRVEEGLVLALWDRRNGLCRWE